MKVIEHKSSRQIASSSKRFRKSSYKPYWGPWPECEWHGIEMKAQRVKFTPPLTAEWKRY